MRRTWVTLMLIRSDVSLYCFFFFQAEDGIRDVAVTGVQTCALPIYQVAGSSVVTCSAWGTTRSASERSADRKSTRLNSSHGYISYAVFCLKKKKKKKNNHNNKKNSAVNYIQHKVTNTEQYPEHRRAT